MCFCVHVRPSWLHAGLGGPTAYAANPARDLGPRIAHAILPIPGKGHSEWAYAWIPFFAPLVGLNYVCRVVRGWCLRLA